MLVNFLDPVNNRVLGDWAPKWADLQELVTRSLEIEEANRGGWVQMVSAIEQQMVEWLPPRPIRRIDNAVISAYERPTLVAVTDRGNRWDEATHRLRLAQVVSQDVIDFLITNAVSVQLACREDDVISIRVPVHRGSFSENREAQTLDLTRLSMRLDRVTER